MKSEAKLILMTAVAVIIVGVLSNAVMRNRASTPAVISPKDEGSFACTMDAKVCPDGTYVGRIPPYCQFAACPSATPSIDSL